MKKHLTDLLEEEDDRPDVTPLIDVVFMLLLFFIVTTTFAEDSFFPITLPTAENSTVRTAGEAATIEISAEGELALDKEFIASEELLYAALSAKKDAAAFKTVVIKADENAPSLHLVNVLDMLRGLEITELAVSAQAQK